MKHHNASSFNGKLSKEGVKETPFFLNCDVNHVRIECKQKGGFLYQPSAYPSKLRKDKVLLGRRVSIPPTESTSFVCNKRIKEALASSDGYSLVRSDVDVVKCNGRRVKEVVTSPLGYSSVNVNVNVNVNDGV